MVGKIIEYIKRKAIIYPDLDLNLDLMFLIYNDLGNLFNGIEVFKESSTSTTIKLILDKLSSSSKKDYHGYTFIRKKQDFLTVNTTELKFHRLYSTNIVHLYNNISNFDFLNYYVYIIRHEDEIRDGLNLVGKKILNIIINYMFTYLYRYNKELSNYIVKFTNILIYDLMLRDRYEDIYCIDTDMIFYFSNSLSDSLIDSIFGNIYDYNRVFNKYIYFRTLKSYIVMDSINELKGIELSSIIKDKSIYNLAYKISGSDYSYSEFYTRNNDYESYLLKARLMLGRVKKLNRILGYG